MLEFKISQELKPNTEILEIIKDYTYICNSTKTKKIKDIDNAIEKLKLQEKKLVDLYLSSTLNVKELIFV